VTPQASPPNAQKFARHPCGSRQKTGPFKEFEDLRQKRACLG
jgi:hypothetical protein